MSFDFFILLNPSFIFFFPLFFIHFQILTEKQSQDPDIEDILCVYIFLPDFEGTLVEVDSPITTSKHWIKEVVGEGIFLAEAIFEKLLLKKLKSGEISAKGIQKYQ